MPDLETQLRRYADDLEARVAPVTADEVLEGGTPSAPGRRRVRLLAAAALVAVLLAGVATLVVSGDDDDADVVAGSGDLEAAGLGDRAVAPEELLGPNALVTVDGDATSGRIAGVAADLDTSSVVERYVYLPYGTAALGHGDQGYDVDLPWGERCAAAYWPAFLVDLDPDPAPDRALDRLRGALAEGTVTPFGHPVGTVDPSPTAAWRDTDVVVWADDAAVEQVQQILGTSPLVVSSEHATPEQLDAAIADETADLEKLLGRRAEELPPPEEILRDVEFAHRFEITVEPDTDVEPLLDTLSSLTAVRVLAAPRVVWAGRDPAAPVEPPDGLDVVPPTHDVEVFMRVEATQAEVEAVRAALESHALVEDLEHLDRDEAYDEFRRIFADEPGLVDDVDPSVLPQSFRVHLAPEADLPSLVDRWITLPGVADVLHADDNLCRPERGAAG